MRRQFLIKKDRILVRNYSNMTQFDSDLVRKQSAISPSLMFASPLSVQYLSAISTEKCREQSAISPLLVRIESDLCLEQSAYSPHIVHVGVKI